MIKDGHIGWREGVAISTLFLTAKVFLLFPTQLINVSFTAAWLVPVISGVGGLGAFFLLERALKRMKAPALLEGVENRLKSPGRVLLGLLLTSSLLFIASVFMREFVETIASTFLPRTPIFIVSLAMILSSSLVAYLGLETVSRTIWFLSPWLILGWLLIILFNIPNANYHLISPILGPGPLPLLQWSGVYLSLFEKIPFMGLLYFAFRSHKDFQKAGYLSLLISIGIMAISVLLFLLVFGAATGSSNPFPMYQLSRLVAVGRFFQRIEAAFLFIWVTVALLFLSMALWTCTMALARVFSMSTHRPLIPALALLILSMLYYPASLPQTLDLDRYVIELYGGILTFGIPLLLFLLSFIPARKGKKTNGSP